MSTFEVKANKLKHYAQEEQKVKTKLRSIQSEITECQKNLQTVLSSSEGAVKQNLTSINQKIGEKTEIIGKMSSVLEAVSSIYLSTEKSVCGAKVSIKDPGQATNVGGNVAVDIAKDIGWGFITGVGTAGKIVDYVNNMWSGTLTVDKLAKWLPKATGAVAKELENPNWVKSFFGVSNEASEGAWKYITKDLKSYIFKSGNESSIANKIGVIAKWAGVAVTGVTRFIGNAEEFKDRGGMSNERFWEETVVETVVDVAKATAVGAVVAGLGFAGWPAALITTGTLVIADTASNAVFHKDLTEMVSDGAVDFGEETGFWDRIKSIGTGVKNIVSCDNVKTKWAYAGGGGAW